jgi:hypothetical protein
MPPGTTGLTDGYLDQLSFAENPDLDLADAVDSPATLTGWESIPVPPPIGWSRQCDRLSFRALTTAAILRCHPVGTAAS